MASARNRSFEGIENFRDFGDYGSRFGGRVVASRLFRSGHFAKATAADLATIEGLQVALIADLRRPTERANDPAARLALFTGQVIDNNIRDMAEGPHIAFMRQTDMSVPSIRRYLTDYYSRAPFEARYRDLFARYFQALAGLDGAAWVHCTAGKDRTGILVALTHDVLGVAESDLAADFLLTNEVMEVERRLPAYGPKLEKMIGRVPSEAAIRCFLGVEWEHLAATFVAIRTQCGSTEEYVVKYLGVEAGAVAAMRERLLR
jgi:protein tyrosine/serine phosphatase